MFKTNNILSTNTDESMYSDVTVNDLETVDPINSFDLNENKRKRRWRNKKNKIYFTNETEKSIIKYNENECPIERNKIYEKGIKFSFEKLVENIYNTFKFCYFDSSAIEVQQQTVCYLVTNMHKYKKEKGKAFSYFSIVAKNYLIYHNNSNYKHFNRHLCISDVQDDSSDVCLQEEDSYYDDMNNKDLINQLIVYWENNIDKLFKKQNDLDIANSIIELFRKCDRLESFNKKMLYLYVREMASCKTQHITKVLNKMKDYQRHSLNQYFDTGVFGE